MRRVGVSLPDKRRQLNEISYFPTISYTTSRIIYAINNRLGNPNKGLTTALDQSSQYYH